eukprot:TRINITY_DN3724_c0_g1_i1.p1 TRINITY_DN3724_c0_g1~~TRINITY_DN3724_c0_g1_i1.p1  ORF type:complete len:585 (+),score=188.66 TRINITY_DN3724_c0_g1_i1:15-1769(+)
MPRRNRKRNKKQVQEDFVNDDITKVVKEKTYIQQEESSSDDVFQNQLDNEVLGLDSYSDDSSSSFDETWGKNVYGADYVDSEIISSEEEAMEEEKEVLLLQKKKDRKRALADFNDDDIMLLKSKKKTKKSINKDDAMLIKSMNDDLERLDDVQKIKKSESFSKAEKLEIIVNDSPELLGLLDSFKTNIEELRERIQPLLQKIKNNELQTSNGVSYLEVKFHLLLSYCTNICYYLLCKADGKPVKDHPVIDHLVHTRVIIEKLAPLDNKLKYQIDKLLKIAALGSSEGLNEGALKHKPNLKKFVNKGEVEEDPDAKYVVQKRMAVRYDDDFERDERKKERAIKRAKNSRMAKLIMEQYGDAPEKYKFEAKDKKALENEEIERYEEDNMIRVNRPKKSDKKKSKPQFMDALADLERYASLTALDMDVEEEDTFSTKKRPLSSITESINSDVSRYSKRAKTTKETPNFGNDTYEEDDYYLETVNNIKAAKLEKKKEREAKRRQNNENTIVEYTEDTADGKRKIDYKVKKKTGIRKKKKKTTRVANRKKYEIAKKRHAGGHQKIKHQKKRNEGIASGINTRIVRSIPL